MSTLTRQLLLTGAGPFAAASCVAGEIILFEYPDFGDRRTHEHYPYNAPPTRGSPP